MKKTTLLIILSVYIVSCGTTPKSSKGIEIAGKNYKVDKSVAKAISEKDNKDKIICTREKTTGSHMATRSCTTLAQRDKERKKNQDKLRKLQNQQSRGYIPAVGGN